MRGVLVIYFVVLIGVQAAPFFGGSSDDSSEATEETTTLAPEPHQSHASDEEAGETTVVAPTAESEHDEESPQSIVTPETTVPEPAEPAERSQEVEEEGEPSATVPTTTEETTVVEETPAPAADDAQVAVAQPIIDNSSGADAEQSVDHQREEEAETTTTIASPLPDLPTAAAQMMEGHAHLEIRLIDENNTQTHVESVIEPPPLSPITPYVTTHGGGSSDDARSQEEAETQQHQQHADDEAAAAVTTPAADAAAASEQQDAHITPDPNTVAAAAAQPQPTDEKWKVAYVSDTVLNLEASTTVATEGEEQAAHHQEDEVTTSPDASLATPDPSAAVDEVHLDDSAATVAASTTLSPIDQVALQKIESVRSLAAGKLMPEGSFPDGVSDEDLPVIEGVNVDDEDDGPEAVEECLLNKHLLAADVVQKMEKQAERLTRMVRKLSKQQREYCTAPLDETGERTIFTDTFSQCPIWREEKMVQYYKLMRVSYCADYGKWPNGGKMVKTYGQYLPLFETLYAFQKQ